MRASLLLLLLLASVICGRAAEAPSGEEIIPAHEFLARQAEIAKLRARLHDWNPQHFTPGTFLAPDGGSLEYRLFQPEAAVGQRYPIILYLHGAGARGRDNLAQLGGLGAGIWTLPENQRERPCFVLAPQCPPEPTAWIKAGDWEPGHHPFHAQGAPPLLQALQLLIALTDELPIDLARVYVIGSSMGGYGTWDLLTRYPSRFAAAVPVCGALADGQASLIKDIPTWIFHGSADDVVPIASSDRAFEQLAAAGGQTRYTILEGGDHGISSYVWTDPRLAQWLFAQRLKSAAPK